MPDANCAAQRQPPQQQSSQRDRRKAGEAHECTPASARAAQRPRRGSARGVGAAAQVGALRSGTSPRVRRGLGARARRCPRARTASPPHAAWQARPSPRVGHGEASIGVRGNGPRLPSQKSEWQAALTRGRRRSRRLGQSADHPWRHEIGERGTRTPHTGGGRGSRAACCQESSRGKRAQVPRVSRTAAQRAATEASPRARLRTASRPTPCPGTCER
mmetsp:Transcript_29735/g.81272  ORF Transcript_29735/g.81272 Transcript_29735/m.81272 type:complete len:217 (-) Transcript_29735:585-1235(-)